MITGAMAATVVPSTSPAAAAFGLRHSTTFALRDGKGVFVAIGVVATDPPVLDTLRVYRVDPLPFLLPRAFEEHELHVFAMLVHDLGTVGSEIVRSWVSVRRGKLLFANMIFGTSADGP